MKPSFLFSEELHVVNSVNICNVDFYALGF